MFTSSKRINGSSKTKYISSSSGSSWLRSQALIEYDIKLTNAEAEAKSNQMIAESLKSYWDNPGWVATEQARLIGPNTKIFGEKIPQIITGAYTNPFEKK
jgi:hypothetical protein